MLTITLRDPDTGHTVRVLRLSDEHTFWHRFDDGPLMSETPIPGSDMESHARRLLLEYPTRQPYQNSKSILLN